MKDVMEPDRCPDSSAYISWHRIPYDLNQAGPPKVAIAFGEEEESLPYKLHRDPPLYEQIMYEVHVSLLVGHVRASSQVANTSHSCRLLALIPDGYPDQWIRRCHTPHSTYSSWGKILSIGNGVTYTGML